MHIELTSTDQATLAAKWCKRNRIPYDLEYWGWPSKTRYRFVFNQEEHMMLFALKWK